MRFPEGVQMILRYLLLPDILELVEANRLNDVREFLAKQPAPEITELLEAVDDKARVLLFRVLPRALADEVFSLLDDIESGAVTSVGEIDARFREMHEQYYSYEWNWAHDVIESWYGLDLSTVSVESLIQLVHRWRDAVVSLDNLIYEDARKEFSLSAMTSFGADGDEKQRNLDFFQVRGASFENDPFVKSVAEHIVAKSQLAHDVLSLLDTL